MIDKRIDVLKDILLRLHDGADAASVQEDFNQHFTGVSALEISMMEHELMGSDTGITFEDVMGLCNVHANLFKGAISDVEAPDAEQEGHPVYLFKQENLALRAAMLRIRRIIENYEKPENEPYRLDLLNGLRHQMSLLGQFDRHYTRKEKLFFPVMERYGHDAPPKVMWGVDDDIRDLFKTTQAKLDQLPNISIDQVSAAFEAFAKEFEEMIFKEEAILLMILLETLTQDDWLAIAKESDAYGYAIIKPTAVWQPYRETFDTPKDLQEETDNKESLVAEDLSDTEQVTRVIDTPEGQLTIQFTPKKDKAAVDRTTTQADLILNHLPMEITFVNKDDIFQYYNDNTEPENMIFKRTPSQIGRHVELCHPPRVLEKVKKIFSLLRSGERNKVTMWYKSERSGKFIYVTYAAVRDRKGDFQGVLEYVQDIQVFRDLDGDASRNI